MNKLQNLISELEKHHKKKLDLSLGRTYNLLKKLGNPQDKLNNIVTVVGTNAKASMSYSLKAILNQAGLKCNMYTSPHLQSYTERFVFNDNEIDEENLFKLLEDTEKVLGDDNATVFEILTCAFLKYAESFKNNINIIEAGLFHQFDSTNVFKKNLSLLKDKGKLIMIAFLSGSVVNADLTEIMTKRLILSGSTLRPRTNQEKARIAKNLYKSYWTALTKKTIKPIIYKIFNLKDASKAHKLMESSKHIGKIILSTNSKERKKVLDCMQIMTSHTEAIFMQKRPDADETNQPTTTIPQPTVVRAMYTLCLHSESTLARCALLALWSVRVACIHTY